MVKKLPSLLFGLLLLAVLAAPVPGIANIWPLFQDKTLRNTVTIDLRKVSAQQGWILSDMPLVSVSSNNFRFLYHPHFRREGVEGCYVFYYVTAHVSACNGK